MNFHRDTIPPIVAAALFSLTFLLIGGCDQANDLIDQAKEKVSDTMEETPDTATTHTAAEPPAPTPQPKPPAPPSPAEVLASFEALKPHEITDGDLQSLTASPEAAAEVDELVLSNGDGNLSAAGLKSLGGLPNLKKLTFQNGKMLPQDLQSLSAAASLTELNISATRANDDVAKAISKITGLETLNLMGTQITPAVGSHLSSLSRLRIVDLSRTAADDTTIAALTALPLESVILMRTRISNVSIQSLIKIPTLRELSVAYTGVNGAGFRGISGSQIAILNVSEIPFGIEGFKALKGARSIEELHVYQAGLVEHKDCNVFRTMSNLKTLNAGNNSLSDAALQVFFKGHRTLESLRLTNHKRITDQGLVALVGIKTLKELDVRDCSVGATGATALKQRIPECTIITSAGIF